MYKVTALVTLLTVVLNTGANDNVVKELRETEIIYTNAGPIRGLHAEDGNYTMFLGIPYAVVDAENPFGLSKPHPIFEETFEAVRNAVACPQMLGNIVIGQIDCLQMNVYVPNNASPSNPLPVLVWVHGGRFLIGFASDYTPRSLVQRDIIVVTINYRVSAYGFMCLNTKEVPGNQGLKDQLLAARWVKENIEFFGGDPNRMTIFGQSAGSMSLHFHLLSPNENYFDQYILHSGAAFSPELVTEASPEIPIKIAAVLGFDTDDANEAVAHLSVTNPHAVINAVIDSGVEIWLCKEPDHVEDRFITDYPINQNIVPKIKGKSILMGYTDDESILFIPQLTIDLENLPMIRNAFEDFFTFDPDQRARTERIVRNFYLGGRPQGEEVRAGMTNFHSDVIFVYPMHRSIESFLENEVEKLYYFKFSYIGQRNLFRERLNITFGGAVHTDELGYLFDFEFNHENTTDEDQLMFDRMLTMWTNFVKYGDPTPEINTLLPVKWEPITKTETPYHYLKIDQELEMDINPFHQRMSFWDILIDGHREYQRGYRVKNNASSIKITYTCVVLALLLAFVK